MKTHALLAAAVIGAAFTAGAMPPGQTTTLTGEVLEVQNVPAYTYLRLKTPQGETWAAVPTAPVAKGARVTLIDPSVMENFESKALNKRFDRIIFASLGTPATASNPHGAPAARPSTVAKIPPATARDAKTVAETVTGATSLKDKTVTIRGQVVKYSAGILGKNWVHLQDGTGSANAGTHDILVTTTDTTAVGAVIDARGTVRTNVDLGSGYTYAVLVEDAKIRK